MYCPECNPHSDDSFKLPPSDVPDVPGHAFWVNEDGARVDVPRQDDPFDHPELTKKIHYECTECGNVWVKTLE